jgi:DnaJ-class molecular chaperone
MKNEKKVELVICGTCKGSGFETIKSCSCVGCEIKQRCTDCNGKGKIKVVRLSKKN